MTNKSEAMYQIRSITSKLERERTRLKNACDERTVYTVKYNSATNPKRSAKYIYRIEMAVKHISDIESYIDDLLTDLKYQIECYADEIETSSRAARRNIDDIQGT